MKNLNQIIMLMLIVLSISSCTKTEEENIVVPITLDCQAYNSEGTFVLEDRGKGVDYIIDCRIPIRGDLTIMPGVVIEFTTDAGIDVISGSVSAIGTEEKMIKFTGVDKVKGAWAGIYFESNDIKNNLTYCLIDYAGGASFTGHNDKAGVIIFKGVTLTVSNCIIKNSKSYGVICRWSGNDLNFIDNTITECIAPFYLRPRYVGYIKGGLYTGNTTDAVLISSYTSSLYEEVTWRNLGIPFRVLDYVDVGEGSKLTLEPGVVIEFEPNASFIIKRYASGSVPSLIAIGTESKPIIFTGVNKVLGAWKGISFYGSLSPINEISFAIIEYASTQNHAAIAVRTSNVKLNNITFKDIQYCTTYEYNSLLYPSNVTRTNITYENSDATICY